MNLKKNLAIVLAVLIIVVAVTACSQKTTEKNLTLDVLIELSQKGSDLSWDDFEEYPSKDVGSGLFISMYVIDEDYSLFIGGGGTDIAPMYIKLVHLDGTEIDVRTEDVESFVQSHKK